MYRIKRLGVFIGLEFASANLPWNIFYVDEKVN